MSYARRPPDPWYIWGDGESFNFNGADTLEQEPTLYRVPKSAIELLFKRMTERAAWHERATHGLNPLTHDTYDRLRAIRGDIQSQLEDDAPVSQETLDAIEGVMDVVHDALPEHAHETDED